MASAQRLFTLATDHAVRINPDESVMPCIARAVATVVAESHARQEPAASASAAVFAAAHILTRCERIIATLCPGSSALAVQAQLMVAMSRVNNHAAVLGPQHIVAAAGRLLDKASGDDPTTGDGGAEGDNAGHTLEAIISVAPFVKDRDALG